MALVVQKFGGATLENSLKVMAAAARVQSHRQKTSEKIVVVVSAMGKTTDNLLNLAHELSEEPPLRDLDTLLNTGEMVSMSLLSIALNKLNCPAIGLCGHQAGIQTDGFFSNASISEINTKKINQYLADDNVVVIAGFQGQTVSGDLTTLGRGGSDTSALALAASLKADRCEILKDVTAVYSADPRLVPTAQPLKDLSYDQLLEMTFWGAKVLQYRSVEIAKYFNIPLYVGPAHSQELGTFVKEKTMIEDSEVLSLNSHEVVLQVNSNLKTTNEAIHWFKSTLDKHRVPFPQMLHTESIDGAIHLFITGAKEIMDMILSYAHQEGVSIHEMSSVTATCRGSTRPETMEKVVDALETQGVRVFNLLISAMSITVFIEKVFRISAIQLLHGLVPTTDISNSESFVRLVK